MLKQELSDDYFANIQAHLERLKFRRGVLVSAKVGKGGKSGDYVLRRPHDDRRSWLTRLLAENPLPTRSNFIRAMRLGIRSCQR